MSILHSNRLYGSLKSFSLSTTTKWPTSKTVYVVDKEKAHTEDTKYFLEAMKTGQTIKADNDGKEIQLRVSKISDKYIEFILIQERRLIMGEIGAAKVAEKMKRDAAIELKKLLGLPLSANSRGIENLIDCIVSAAVLEVAVLHKEVMKEKYELRRE
jgi:hypothetical protein